MSYSTPRPHTSERIGAILGGPLPSEGYAQREPLRSGRRHYIASVDRTEGEPIAASYAGLQSSKYNSRQERNNSSDLLRKVTPPVMAPRDAAGGRVHEVPADRLHWGRRPAQCPTQRVSNLYGACCEPQAGAGGSTEEREATGRAPSAPLPAESEAPVGRGGNLTHPELASHVEYGSMVPVAGSSDGPHPGRSARSLSFHSTVLPTATCLAAPGSEEVHQTRRRHVADASAYRDNVAEGIMHPVVQCAHARPSAARPATAPQSAEAREALAERLDVRREMASRQTSSTIFMGLQYPA